MSTEVATRSQSLLPEDFTMARAKFEDPQALERMAAGSFLPRVMQLQGLSRMVTKQRLEPGALVLIKGKDSLVKNYGESMSCLVIHRRPKALEFLPDGKGKAYFDPKSADFQRVEGKALMKPRPKGFLFGLEYLIYLPDVDQIATFFFSTPTMRNRSNEMSAQRGKTTIVESHIIERGGDTWYGPEIKDTSSPIGLPDQGSPEWDNLMTRIKPQLDSFLDPKEKTAVEEVADTEDKSERPQ